MGRKSSGQNYRGAGAFYRQDDRSGFTVRAYNTKQEWTGLIVDESIWEPRNAQDFVRGVRDDQTVPLPRPLPEPTYDGPIYIALTANVAIGATFIPLGSIAGLSVNDEIGVMMDNGVIFRSTISSITSTGVNITGALPWPASSGNLMVDYLITIVVPAVGSLLLESGDFLLLEDGSGTLLLE